ncbi:MAG: ABC transporter substrate-binding protein [Caldilineaceae bacterium]
MMLRDLFNNKDFRVALSLGIDREAINDAVFFGLAKPSPRSRCRPIATFSRSGRSNTSNMTPDQANQLLDGLGVTERERRRLPPPA